MRRLFYIALGASVGVIAVRRVTAAANKWTPKGLAEQAGGLGEQATSWWSEVMEFAAERETELREALGLDSDSEDSSAETTAKKDRH